MHLKFIACLVISRGASGALADPLDAPPRLFVELL